MFPDISQAFAAFWRELVSGYSAGLDFRQPNIRSSACLESSSTPRIISVSYTHLDVYKRQVFYLLGNFGYQYGTFPNLPMVSEGRISILFNMLLLGMIFSAYRYDRVMGVMMEGENAGVFYAG